MDGNKPDENKNPSNGDLSKREVTDANMVEINDIQYMFGWRRFKPKWLQVLNSPRWFIAFMTIFSCCQGILVNGVTSIAIPDLEREFGFSSKESGIILASNDASGILLVGIVSYIGAKGHKPKWIGYGSIITGLGALIFAVPKLIIGKYSPGDLTITPSARGLCPLGTNTTHMHSPCQDGIVDSSTLSLAVFSIAQLIMGAGTTPLYTLGPAFLDENVNPKVSPVYLGIWFATTAIGPPVGYVVGGLFVSKYTDLKLPNGINLSRSDPRWVGAWWLGYITISWFLIFTGVILLAYPKVLLKSRQKREEAVKKGHLPGADEALGIGWKGLLPSLLQLLKNKTYIFVVIALIMKSLYIVSIGAFFAKIIKVKFQSESTLIGIALGIIIIPGVGGGIMLGSFIMKKIKLRESVKKGALICTIVGFLTVAFSTSWLIPGCNNAVLAGLDKPYINETSASGLVATCNSHCTCSERVFDPVCGPDKVTYFSSCHAGCQDRNGESSFANCTCIHPGLLNGTNNREVEQGYCDRNCGNLPLFMTSIGCVILFVFINAIPHKMVVLRSVPDNQRSFALGVQFVFMRSLSFIPGPIIFGSVIDASCTVWQTNDCGKRLSCSAYEVDTLSRNVVIFGCVTSFISSAMYLLTYLSYKQPDALGKTMSRKELCKEETNSTSVPSMQKLPTI